MRNLGLRCFSIIVAILLAWYVHSASNSVVRTFISSVELRQVPDGKVIISPLNPSAQVTVRGPSFIVGKIPSSPPVFSVTFPEGVSSRHRAQLDANTLPLPPHLEVLNVDPQEIEFVLDDLVQEEVPVVVPRIGAVEESLKVQLTPVPDRIMISGPKSELKAIASLETEPVDLRSIKQDIELKHLIRNAPHLTQLSSEQILIQVRVSPVSAERRIDQVPLELRAMPGIQLGLEPNRVSVEFRGPKAAVNGLKRSEIAAFVRVPEGVTENSEQRVTVELPQGLELLSVDPKNVNVVLIPEVKSDLAKGTASKKKR